jgi:hypothetical protein
MVREMQSTSSCPAEDLDSPLAAAATLDTAVKQWCPECDPDGPKSTRRSIAIEPTLWCPEADPHQPSARCQMPGSWMPVRGSHEQLRGSPAHWIPETADVPVRNVSKLSYAVNLRRALSPRTMRGVTPCTSALGHRISGRGDGGVVSERELARENEREQEWERVAPKTNNLEIIHAMRPFFSHGVTPLRGDAGRASPAAHALEAAPGTPLAPEGPASAQTATTERALTVRTPHSHDDAGWVDSAPRQQELSSMPLTPGKFARGDGSQDVLAASAREQTGASNVVKVLHNGPGGIGRRKQALGCNGRYAKCQVVRSRQCSLRTRGTGVEFVFAQGSQYMECIALSRDTKLHIKGGRVELVQPDGRHMWLWNVAPQALSLVHETFAALQRYQSEAQLVMPITVLHPPFDAANDIEKKRNRRKDAHGHGERYEVQLGFVPGDAGAVVPSDSAALAATPAAPGRTASVLEGTPVLQGTPAPVENPRTKVPALRLHELQAPQPYTPSPLVPSGASRSETSSSSALLSDANSTQPSTPKVPFIRPMMMTVYGVCRHRCCWCVRAWCMLP